MNFNSFKRCNGKILFVFIWNCHINTYRHHTFPTDLSEIPFGHPAQKYLSDIYLLSSLTYVREGTKKCKLRLLATNSFFVVSHLYLYLLSTYLVPFHSNVRSKSWKNQVTIYSTWAYHLILVKDTAAYFWDWARRRIRYHLFVKAPRSSLAERQQIRKVHVSRSPWLSQMKSFVSCKTFHSAKRLRN